MITDINSEDRAVQQTFAEYLESELGWDSLYAWNQENFGPDSLLGRSTERDVVLTRDLRVAIERFNPDLPASAVDDVVRKLTQTNFARTMIQHNQEPSRSGCAGRRLTSGIKCEMRPAQPDLRHLFCDRMTACRTLTSPA